MSRHVANAATATNGAPSFEAAADDAGDPVPKTADRHVSTLLGRMLRLLGFTSGRDSTGGFELVPSADEDTEATGKGDTAPGEGAQAWSQQTRGNASSVPSSRERNIWPSPDSQCRWS